MPSETVSQLTFAVSTVSALFVAVDPFGCVPLFVSISEGDTLAEKRRAAFRSSLVAGVTLTVFAVTGRVLFQLLGISVGAFRIAGGILLFLLAVDMVRAQKSRQKTTPEEEAESAQKPDFSVFPMGIPMLAGPASTSTVMVLVTRSQGPLEYAIVLIAIASTLFITYWILRSAAAVARRLGQTGMNVLERVMGLVLAAVAVQFVVDGVALVWPKIGS